MNVNIPSVYIHVENTLNLTVRGLSVRGEQMRMTNSGLLSKTVQLVLLTSRSLQLLSSLFSKFLNKFENIYLYISCLIGLASWHVHCPVKSIPWFDLMIMTKGRLHLQSKKSKA